MTGKRTDKVGHGPFKSDNGLFRTSSLFKETINAVSILTYVPPFTLDEQDKEGYVSLHRIYMEYADISEHSFAKAVFNSWEQWVRLLACDWFAVHVDRWRAELKAKIQAEGLHSIRLLAQDRKSSATALAAAKYLVNGNYEVSQELKEKVETSRRVRKAGRPKKVVEPEPVDESIKDDFKRLGLH